MNPKYVLPFFAAVCAFGQVSSNRLIHAADEPGNWLTFSEIGRAHV